MAHVADWVLLLARSDPASSSYDGFTMFLFPTSTPGFLFDPIWTLSTERSNATFYDDVRVGRGYVLGEEHQGWRTLGVMLGVERGRGQHGLRGTATATGGGLGRTPPGAWMTPRSAPAGAHRHRQRGGQAPHAALAVAVAHGRPCAATRDPRRRCSPPRRYQQLGRQPSRRWPRPDRCWASTSRAPRPVAGSTTTSPLGAPDHPGRHQRDQPQQHRRAPARPAPCSGLSGSVRGGWWTRTERAIANLAGGRSEARRSRPWRSARWRTPRPWRSYRGKRRPVVGQRQAVAAREGGAYVCQLLQLRVCAHRWGRVEP